MSIELIMSIFSGILICRENSEVWLYNQSNVEVFVSSAALPGPIDDPCRDSSPAVCKIEAGHTLKIFSYDLADQLSSRMSAKRNKCSGPVDLFCVNVSFCKGWGASYKRREITSLPCWLQLHLEPPRWWGDGQSLSRGSHPPFRFYYFSTLEFSSPSLYLYILCFLSFLHLVEFHALKVVTFSNSGFN